MTKTEDQDQEQGRLLERLEHASRLVDSLSKYVLELEAEIKTLKEQGANVQNEQGQMLLNL